MAVREVGVRRSLGVAVVLVACASPEIRERCRYVTEHTREPEMAQELAAIDRLLLNRTLRITVEVREFDRSLSVPFQQNYAKAFLPQYCGQLDLARTLAAGGKVEQAARVYQGLLLASQVMELAVAVMRIANHADEIGQIRRADHQGPQGVRVPDAAAAGCRREQ